MAEKNADDKVALLQAKVVDKKEETFCLQSQHGVTVCRHCPDKTLIFVSQEGKGFQGVDFDAAAPSEEWHDVDGVSTKFKVPVVFSKNDDWPNVQDGRYLQARSSRIYMQVKPAGEVITNQKWKSFLAHHEKHVQKADDSDSVAVLSEFNVFVGHGSGKHLKRWCTVSSVDKGLWNYLCDPCNFNAKQEFYLIIRKDCVEDMFLWLQKEPLNRMRCNTCGELAGGLPCDMLKFEGNVISSHWSFRCSNHQI